ncbi:MAG: hypothetical protein AAF231_04835 [Pseudomonadota bacterium]
MGVRRDTWLSQTGLKLIRVVIGSHFCAMAMGVPLGFDPFFLVGLMIPGQVGQIVGAASLLTLAIAFVFGVMLRPVSLMLAGFLIFSATATLLLTAEVGNIGALWQSIALGAAVMLCYGAMRPHEMHRTALLPVRTARGAVAREIKDGVAPRRVRPKGRVAKVERPDPFAKTFAPLIAPTEQMIGVAKTDRPARKRIAVRDEVADEDVENIFVNL